MSHTIEHSALTDSDGLHEPKGVSALTSGATDSGKVYVADGAGSGTWQNPEGTDTASTGESANTVLTADGSAGASWALPVVTNLSTTGAADKDILVADGAGGSSWQKWPYGGVYVDAISSPVTLTGSGAAMTRISDIITTAAQTSTPVEFTVNTDGSLTYTGTLTRHFHIAQTLSCDISAGTNVTVQAQLQKYTDATTSWAAITGSNVQFNIAASGAGGSTAVHADVMLATNDKLVLAFNNIDTATDVILVTHYLFATGMPGT